jgi:cupin 2 domain-containing protein
MNLLSNLPDKLPEELTTVLQQGRGIRSKRSFRPATSPPEGFWYDQTEHELAMVLTGAARLAFEDRVVEMISGDSINIPAYARHRVEWTTPDQPTVWLAVYYGAELSSGPSRETTNKVQR